MPKSTKTKIAFNINDVLTKPYGLIGKKDHTFGEALDHFTAKLKSLPNVKMHQKMLLEFGLFLVELKAQFPDTKQFSDFVAKTELGGYAKKKWGKNAPTEMSKLQILATQAKHVTAFIEAGVSDSIGGTGMLKAYNAFAAKNDLPKAEGQQRKAKADKPSEQPKADKQTGNASQSQPNKAESQSGKTDKPAVQQTVKSDSKPSVSAIAEQLVNTINDTVIGYGLSEDEASEVFEKLFAAFDRDLPVASAVDMGNVTVMAKAMQKAQAAS